MGLRGPWSGSPPGRAGPHLISEARVGQPGLARRTGSPPPTPGTSHHPDSHWPVEGEPAHRPTEPWKCPTTHQGHRESPTQPPGVPPCVQRHVARALTLRK